MEPPVGASAAANGPEDPRVADMEQKYRAKIASLEEEVRELRQRLDSLEASPDSDYGDLQLPQSLDDASIDSPHMSTIKRISPHTSPILYPAQLLSKVTSKVQKMWAVSSSPESVPSGPLTVRRNSGMSRLSDETQTDRIVIPESVKRGITVLRVTHKKRVSRVLKLNDATGVLSWNYKPSSQLSLDRICEIYPGAQARNYREEFKVGVDMESRWITIIHQRDGDTKLRSLHLIVSTQRDFDALITCLVQMVAFRREIMSGVARAGPRFVDMCWTKASGSHGYLTFDDVEALTKRLHVNCSRKHIRDLFERADMDKSNTLSFSEFQKLVRLLQQRDDVSEVFRSVCPSGEMNRAEFEYFILHIQKQAFVHSDITRMFVQRAQLESNTINEETFRDFISSWAVFPATKEDNHDLNRPLNEYWISSSHNTYLTGRQVAASSSVESYIRALQDGCRSIEIDCWDGVNGPMVCHGHAVTRLTGSIEFEDVIRAVRKYAFITSPYPLILSLEIRCNEANQQKIVASLKAVLEDLLITKPLQPGSLTLPSPAELKHRVLIKVKAAMLGELLSKTDSSSSFETSDDTLASSPSRGKPKEKQASRVIPALADLGVYMSGIKFRNFKLPESRSPTHIFSFSESTFKNKIRDQETLRQFSKHNMRYLSRIYPSPYRITSTNFDPIPYWRLGVQMVALNWQKHDIGIQLNHAFHSNKVGYVLKPAQLRDPTYTPPRKSRRYKFAFQIISAQQLPRPNIRQEEALNPYVVADLFGVEDYAPQFKTQAVTNNGYNPRWDFNFELELSEMDLEFACVKISVATQEAAFASFTGKLSRLHQGYRHLPLQDNLGEEYIFSSLFIKLDMTLL